MAPATAARAAGPTPAPRGTRSRAHLAPPRPRNLRPAPSVRTRAPRAEEPERAPAAQDLGVTHGLLDRLLRDRSWIAFVGLLLVGIVFLNVRLLVLDGGIARDAARAVELKRENAALRLRAARLGSSERIQRVAAERGLVWPAPGRTRYLRPNPSADARLAARTITAPMAARDPAEASPTAAGAAATSGAPGASGGASGASSGSAPAADQPGTPDPSATAGASVTATGPAEATPAAATTAAPIPSAE